MNTLIDRFEQSLLEQNMADSTVKSYLESVHIYYIMCVKAKSV